MFSEGDIMKKLIDKYIALRLSLKVFRLDREKFKEFKAANIYLDKLDAVIDQVRKDLHTLKRDLIVRHHLDIKKINDFEYSVNGSVYSYTSDELKEMTEDMMVKYLMSVKSIRTGRVWMN